MTLRYAHLSPGHKRRAVDILGESINGQVAESRDNLVPIWSPESLSRFTPEAKDTELIDKYIVT